MTVARWLLVPLLTLPVVAQEQRGAQAAPTEQVAPDPEALAAEPAAELPPLESELHPLTYPDGTTTPNDRCPIRLRKLSLKIEPVWVNGIPIGFC